MYHVLYGLVGTLHFLIDLWGLYACDFDNDVMLKTDFNEVFRLGELVILVKMENLSLLYMVVGYIYKGLDELDWGALGYFCIYK